MGATIAASNEVAKPQSKTMMDLLFVLLIVAFFALGAWYVRGLERLHGGAENE